MFPSNIWVYLQIGVAISVKKNRKKTQLSGSIRALSLCREIIAAFREEGAGWMLTGGWPLVRGGPIFFIPLSPFYLSLRSRFTWLAVLF